jgi:hypothetical protein
MTTARIDSFTPLNATGKSGDCNTFVSIRVQTASIGSNRWTLLTVHLQLHDIPVSSWAYILLRESHANSPV